MSLWQAISNGEYDKALNLIKKNSELVNAENDDHDSVLMVALGMKDKPMELIQFITTHKQFNLCYKNPETNETNMDAMIATASLDILKLAHDQEGFLINGTKLTYSTLCTRLATAERIFNREKEKTPKGRGFLQSQARMEGFAAMVAYMREETMQEKAINTPAILDALIRHAIATDDVTLFEQLEKLGKDTSANLSDGTDPSTLVTGKSPKSKDWFEQKAFDKALAEMSSSQKEREGLGESMKQLKKLETSAKALTERHKKAQIKLIAEAVDKRIESLEKIVSPSSH